MRESKLIEEIKKYNESVNKEVIVAKNEKLELTKENEDIKKRIETFKKSIKSNNLKRICIVSGSLLPFLGMFAGGISILVFCAIGFVSFGIGALIGWAINYWNLETEVEIDKLSFKYSENNSKIEKLDIEIKNLKENKKIFLKELKAKSLSPKNTKIIKRENKKQIKMNSNQKIKNDENNLIN